MRLTAVLGLAAIAALLAAAPAGRAEDFPSRPVRLINPWPAGGSSDSVARLVGAQLSEALGQPVVVENRPGATGTIGAGAVAKAPPDGYTLMVTTNSTYAIAPHLYHDLPYDGATAFAPINLIGRNAQILCVNPALPAADMNSFIGYIKAHPDQVPFSTAGQGATSHLATELLMMTAGLKMMHVPYRGGAPSVQAVLAGETSVSFVDVITALPYVAAGQLRALGASTLARAAMMPDVPTIDAAGVPGFQSSTDFALFAPAATPPAIVARLVAATHQALRSGDVAARLRGQGIEVVDGGPDMFGGYFQSELDKWGRVIKSRHIHLE
jgi:tripartite-type tricarboxylate transporter receptor subunit TctC